MDVIIRKATIIDYEILCELFDEIDALHREHLPHIYRKPIGPVREQDYYLALLADPENVIFVAEVGRHLCGVIHAVFRQAPAIPVLIPRSYAFIDSIVVKSEFHNRGIGQKLMDTAQVWAVEKGASSIELNVFDFNQSAIAFYQRLGYATLSRKMNKAVG